MVRTALSHAPVSACLQRASHSNPAVTPVQRLYISFTAHPSLQKLLFFLVGKDGMSILERALPAMHDFAFPMAFSAMRLAYLIQC